MGQTTTDSPPSDHKTLWDKIKGIRFGMLTHRHPSGLLHSHPMTTQNKSLDEGEVLYFFVSAQSEMVSSLNKDGMVNISYASPQDDSYVSVAGVARVTHDPTRVQQLWSSGAQTWFPKGPADPDLALLEVRIEHAEFWDVKESKVTQLFKKAKAALTGSRPQLGEHRSVDMR